MGVGGQIRKRWDKGVDTNRQAHQPFANSIHHSLPSHQLGLLQPVISGIH